MQAAGLQHLVMTLLPLRLDTGNVLLGRILHGGNLILPVAAKHDVGTTARHIGGNGHRAGPARLGDDLSLGFVMLGVQDLVLDARFPEQ